MGWRAGREVRRSLFFFFDSTPAVSASLPPCRPASLPLCHPVCVRVSLSRISQVGFSHLFSSVDRTIEDKVVRLVLQTPPRRNRKRAFLSHEFGRDFASAFSNGRSSRPIDRRRVRDARSRGVGSFETRVRTRVEGPAPFLSSHVHVHELASETRDFAFERFGARA